MSRGSASLVGPVAFVFITAGLAAGQPNGRPHLEFIRGLRKEGLADMALQYLDQLKANNPPKEIAELLPLEYARTWLDLATEENEESKRNALMGQARREIEEFLKSHPNHDLAPRANVELARLYYVQGRTQLRRAANIENEDRKAAEMKTARPALQTAAKKYEQAVGLLDGQIKKLQGDKSPAGIKQLRELEDERWQARLDEAITYSYLGDTYVVLESKDTIERAKQFTEAAKRFKAITNAGENLPISWIARAWHANTMITAGDPMEGESELKNLLTKKQLPAAAAGVRVGRYFAILNAFNQNTDWAKLEKDTSDWLRDYRAYRDTNEGLGARWRLARAEEMLAEKSRGGITTDKNTGRIVGVSSYAKTKLDAAQQHYKELIEPENEYSERANRHRSEILVKLADAEGRGADPAPESLPSFDRCYLMAQVQVARFWQYRRGGAAAKKQPTEDDIAKEERRRYKNAIRYLDRGLALANPLKDGVREVFSAQLLLVVCYSQLKMDQQAAVLADNLARTNPKLHKGAVAAALAVGAYFRSKIEADKSKANSTIPADPAEREQFEKQWDLRIKSIVDRLRSLGAYAIKQWPSETATDHTRSVIARFDLDENRFEEAWSNLAEIHNSYSNLQWARLQLANSMLKLVLPTEIKKGAEFRTAVKENINRRIEQWKKTVALLESTPIPAGTTSSNDVIYYVDSRAKLVRLYDLEEVPEKGQKIGEALLQSLDSFDGLSDAEKVVVGLASRWVDLEAVRIQAAAEFRNGNHARVAELLDRRLDDMKKEFAKPATADDSVNLQNLRKLQRQTIMLGVQSAAADGKTDRASALLDLLSNSGGTPEESLAMLQSLVFSVRAQIDELEAAKKQTEATTVKEGFAKLLEKMSEKIDSLPTKMKLFLAQGLGNVDAFDKAVAILNAVRQNPGEGAPEEQQKFQKQAQVLLARTYRSAKQYDKSMAVFQEMIGTKQKEGWAYAHLQIHKEKALMMEDRALNAPENERVKRWSEAVQEWVAISRMFASRLEPLRIPLPPQEEVKKSFLTSFMGKRQRPNAAAGTAVEAELANFFLDFGSAYSRERAEAPQLREQSGRKRDLYFQLGFEQERCSTMAYKNLGLSAFSKDLDKQAKLDQKFDKIAGTFFQMQSKNPDLSQAIKDRIQELINSVPELKKAYDKQLKAKR